MVCMWFVCGNFDVFPKQPQGDSLLVYIHVNQNGTVTVVMSIEVYLKGQLNDYRSFLEGDCQRF